MKKKRKKGGKSIELFRKFEVGALELKADKAYILKIILEQKNGYTVDRIVKLNITKRTFYYDLN